MPQLTKYTLLLLVPIYGACSMTYLGYSRQVVERDWATASDAPAGLAPDPATTHDAVVQVYAARVAEWHGYFGVHTWIAVKRSGAARFVVYEVTRAALERTGSAVMTHERVADAHWYGNRPDLLTDVRGPGVDRLISRIELAALHYPLANRYRIWPGPNSNTFVAYIGRAIPELRLDLPGTAVGKDYLVATPFAKTPSGTGVQVSAFGLVGLAAGGHEGVELNLMGLTRGIDPNDVSLELPLLGRVGPPRSTRPTRIEQ